MQCKSEARILLNNRKTQREQRACVINNAEDTAGSPVRGRLQFFNEIRLNASDTIVTEGGEDVCVILIPVAGGLECVRNNQSPFYISPGMALAEEGNGTRLQIANPYETETVYWLEIGLKVRREDAASEIVEFDLSLKNELIELPFRTYQGVKVYLGRFDGRGEYDLRPSFSDGALFAFVIQGAFEIQGRLLETGDALELWSLQENVEMEALSSEALLLVIKAGNAELQP